MTSTPTPTGPGTTPASSGPTAPAPTGTGVDPVAGEAARVLQARAVLDTIGERRAVADAAEADVLALVVDFVGLHPVLGPDGTALEPWEVASLGPHPRVLLVGPPQVCPLAGVGTPQVTEDTVAALGAALGVSYRVALCLVGEALELAYRLPRIWGLVRSGRLPAWKGRRVAAATSSLSMAAAGFVDRHIATTIKPTATGPATGAGVPGPARLRALVHEALLRCDPETAAGREEAVLRARDVVFDHRDSTATTTVSATMDTLDALDLDATVSALAAQMGRLGDGDPVGVRRSHALGLLAHPQRILDLFGDPRPDHPLPDTVHPHPAHAAGVRRLGCRLSRCRRRRCRRVACGGPVAGSPDRWRSGPGSGSGLASGPGATVCPGPGSPVGGWNAATATLYLHIDASDLAADLAADLATPGEGVGGVERLDAATLTLLRDWLRRVDRVTIRPVLDLNRTDTLNRHDPPGWLRDLVTLRDGTCVFPGCTTTARSCDLDHITPYLDPTDGGPPGQTSAENLACLCRRHHRLKTFTTWDYHRARDGDYTWTSPLGQTYRTSPQPLTPPRHP